MTELRTIRTSANRWRQLRLLAQSIERMARANATIDFVGSGTAQMKLQEAVLFEEIFQSTLEKIEREEVRLTAELLDAERIAKQRKDQK